ncbi:hypothetical protein ACIGFK_11025 [Streptomyces sp. NPDC085524]|uniref:hypothetical protein n=1 Tax=unclassified Streptomyces TaxID=2593676 RepID=UPI0035D8E95A
MSKMKETVRWSPVGILLVLALVAPLFGDSPTAVVIPLLLAMMLAGANVAVQKNGRARNGG